METAKLFTNGQSQTIRLPKEYQFPEKEVGITQFGEMVILFPKNKKEEIFFSSLGEFTEDVFDSITAARKENYLDSSRIC